MAPKSGKHFAFHSEYSRMSLTSVSLDRVQRDVVANLKQVLSSREEELRSTQSRLNRCRQARERYERRKNDLRVECQRKEDRVEELEEALQKESGENSDLEVLQANLRDTDEERRLNEGSLKDCADAMTEMMQNLKEIRQQMSAKDVEIAQFKEELRVAESEQHLVADKWRKRIGEKNTAIEHIEDFHRGRSRLKQKLEESEARVHDYCEKASLVSERVEIDRGETAASLDEKLERLHQDITRYNREYVHGYFPGLYVH